MWSSKELKKLNGSESDDEALEVWTKDKELIFELIDHLDKVKLNLKNLDSYLQASYHTCRDLVHLGEPTSQILFKEMAVDTVVLATKFRRLSNEIVAMQVKSWAQHKRLEEKNKTTPKKRKRKKKNP